MTTNPCTTRRTPTGGTGEGRCRHFPCAPGPLICSAGAHSPVVRAAVYGCRSLGGARAAARWGEVCGRGEDQGQQGRSEGDRQDRARGPVRDFDRGRGRARGGQAGPGAAHYAEARSVGIFITF